MQLGMFMGNEPLKLKKPIRLIELFAGIGSQAKALQNLNANFEHWKVCEFDKYAIQSYNAIHGTNFGTSDITKLKGYDLEIVETYKYDYILTYSFPCQDLSVAGKMAGMGKGTRSGLLWEIERLLTETKELPQTLLMENVPEVVGKRNIEQFAKWLEFLENLGYKCFWQNLNAKDYGIPQNRNRTFMVSTLYDSFYKFSKPKKLKLKLGDMLEPTVDERFYLSERALNGIMFTQFNCGTLESRTEKNGIMPTLCARDYKDAKLVVEPQLEQVAQLGGEFESSGRVYGKNGVSPTINTCGGGNREPKVLEGNTAYGYYTHDSEAFAKPPLKDLSRTIKAEKHDAGVVMSVNCINQYDENGKQRKQHERIYDEIGLMTALCPGVNGRHNIKTLLHTRADTMGVYRDYRIRKLTPKECWRLMGFTDTDFDKAQSSGISNSQLYKQAGNSIVVNVLEAIFKEML